MSASENQADEASKDTTDRKICALGIKIRIRLPPRKRLSDGLQTMNTGVPEDTKNLPAKKVLEQTDNSTRSMAFTATKVKVEKTNSSPSGEGVPEDTKSLPAKEGPEQIDNNTRSMPFTVTKVNVEEANNNPSGEEVPEDTKSLPDEKVSGHTDNSNQNMAFSAIKVKVEEANINNLIKTLSRDTLPEEANFMILSKKLTTTTGMVGKEESSYIVGNVPCEEGNETILSKGFPPLNSRNTPIKESCVGATNNTPSKNLSITGVKVEKCNSRTRPREDASNYALSNRLLYVTNSNTSTKGVPEEATINNPSKNVATSAVKCEEVNDNSVGNSLVEEARNNIAAEKLCAEARNKSSSRRPTIPANDKRSRKNLRTSVVHATGTSQNTCGMKSFNSVGQAVEQSTSLEAIKEYKEFEEKVRTTVYLDNLSPLATEAVIKMALNQFGSVRKVSFLANYTVPYDIPQSALVEMETEKDAESVINMLHEFPFMMSGMPRPVRGKRATAEMFNDRPRRPGSKLEFRWLGPTDPDYENARKFKLMSKRHEVENLALIKHQLEEEELLAKQQQDNLSCNYRKLEAVDTIILSGWVNRLSYIYNISLDGVF